MQALQAMVDVSQVLHPVEQAVQVWAEASLKYPSMQAVQALASEAAVQILQPVEQAVQPLAVLTIYSSLQAVQTATSLHVVQWRSVQVVATEVKMRERRTN